MELRPEQTAVVESEADTIVVSACPGSGKTTALVHTAAGWITKHRRPECMALITFTRRAASQMRHRLRSMVGPEVDEVCIGTFHSLCYMTLARFWHLAGYRHPGILIVDPIDRKNYVFEAWQAAREKRPTYITDEIDRYGAGLISPAEASEVLKAYRRLLVDDNACDYALLGAEVMELADRHKEVDGWLRMRCGWMLVDEVQDSDRLQAAFYRRFAEQRLLVVGDSDQGIYGWRHADPRVMAEFKDAEQRCLTVNNRSSEEVVAVAEGFRKNIPQVLPRVPMVSGSAAPGNVTAIPEVDLEEFLRAEAANGSSIGMLFRTNFQAHEMVRRLDVAGIPYSWATSRDRLLEMPGVRETMAYIAWADFPDAGVLMDRVLACEGWSVTQRWELKRRAREAATELYDAATSDLPESDKLCTMCRNTGEFFRSIQDEGFLERLVSCAVRVKRSRGGGGQESYRAFKDLQDAAAEYVADTPAKHRSGGGFLHWLIAKESTGQGSGGVQVMTVHAAKGLEFDTVLLCGLERDKFPWRGDDARDMDEERRIFYVAMTRAKSKLVIVVPPPNVLPSRFIDETLSVRERISHAVQRHHL